MSKKLYVFSTLATAQLYTDYAMGANDLPIPGRAVHVNGGFGSADKFLRTATGAAITSITEQDADLLRRNEVFKLHQANNFVSISEHLGDPNDIAADMDRNDASKPLTPDDFGERSGTITTGAPSDGEDPTPARGKNTRK